MRAASSEGNMFAVYKPKGPTSFDVVRRVREITGEKKVGHAGTLDPLAEGVLVIAVGNATKKIQEVVAKEKEYETTIRLGVTSTTDDEEGEKAEIPLLRNGFGSRAISKPPSIKEVTAVIQKFIGTILQVPPAYSAVKIKGKAAYQYARQGKKIDLEAREVFVKNIILRRYKWPRLELSVTTGPGVYIRSLARDVGAALGVGGYVEDLKRLRVGEFTAGKAILYNELEFFFKRSKNQST
jgi:tRNA pseudouridine55 synthase